MGRAGGGQTIFGERVLSLTSPRTNPLSTFASVLSTSRFKSTRFGSANISQ